MGKLTLYILVEELYIYTEPKKPTKKSTRNFD